MELISLAPLWWLLLLIPWLIGFRFSLVDAPLWKRSLAFALRLAAFVLLVLALCRPFARTPSGKLHVAFLVDVSQSVNLPAMRLAIDEIESAREGLGAADSWTLVAVADGYRDMATPTALRAMLDRWETAGSDDRFRSATRLGEAMLDVRARFPAGAMKRIVVFSDGHDTTDALDDAIRQVEAEGFDVRFRRLDALDVSEAVVDALIPSTTHAWMGEVVRMSVEVRSNCIGQGQLRMVNRGVVVQEQTVALKPGIPNRFFFDVDMVTPGAGQWTAELIAEHDHFAINNQRTCTVSVRGQPRILFLHQNETELRPLVRALQEQDLSCEVRGQRGVPDSISDLLAFDAVVLADVPATAISQRQMELLRQYVVDFGGGLAMFGSENSFGLGGYHKTPVEEVLPLVSRFEKEKEKPSLAMVLVIDKSGSMEGMPMALAREAAKSAVELLGPRDQIGVVGFDGEPLMVSEMRMGTESAAINASIDGLAAGGGTNMYPAMLVAREMLNGVSAKIRHMICLSDGQTEAADHEGLAQVMADSGITISTVALGDADRALMARIAEVGRGRYYETDDPANIPQIFTSETMQASRSAIREDLFGTVPMTDHPILTGFAEADLPFTLGYVMTQSKPAAQVLLVAETGDPLLAIGRFGLGSGIAWSSDMSGRWGAEWLAWSDCGKFWAQVFRGMIRARSNEGSQVQAWVENGNWHLDIRRQDSAGVPLSGVDWELASLLDTGAVMTWPVREVGLGHYTADIPLSESQAKSMSVRLRDRGSDQIQVVHYDRPWPAEYALPDQLPETLERIGAFDARDIRSDLVPSRSRVAVAHWFYFTAVLLLLASSLVRRI